MSNNQINFNELAGQLKALGNPHRLALFYRLSTCCPPGTTCPASEALKLSVGQLGEGMGIAPSTLSHHLKELHTAGLIRMQRQGKTVLCSVDPDTLADLARFFKGDVS